MFYLYLLTLTLSCLSLNCRHLGTIGSVGAIFYFRENLKEDTKNLEELSERIKDMDRYDTEFIKEVFKYYKIDVSSKDEETKLHYFTSMHNDFNEGMHNLLKEIVLYFSFDTDFKVKCHREDIS